MKSIVSKWGNSLAIRIPNYIAKELNLEEKSHVQLEILEEKLIVTPVNNKREYKLDELLAGITEDNNHPEYW